MKGSSTITMALLAAALLSIPGCGDDDDGGGTADADTDADTDTDADADTDADTDADAGSGANGEFCELHQECLSGFCETYQGVPVDPDGVCADAVPEGQIRILANVRNFYTGEYLPGQAVKITGAMLALVSPSGSEALATATTDSDGRFEVIGGTEVTSAAAGIVAVTEAAGCFLTISGLTEPADDGGYPPGIRNHDVKVVSQSLLDTWSGYLAEFTEAASYLPLGQAGAVFGSIRYVESGVGVAGAHLASRLESSNALIFYLNEAEDGFNQTATGSSGMYVLFNPGIAEEFDAVKDGVVVSRSPSTVGQAAGSVYTTTVNVEGTGE